MHNKLGQSNCLLSSTIAFYSTPSRGISQVSTCIKKTPDPVHLTQPSRYNLSFQSSPHSISSSRVTLQLGNNIFPTLVITFSIPYWKISHIFSSCWSARLSWFLVVLDALIIYRHYPYIYIYIYSPLYYNSTQHSSVRRSEVHQQTRKDCNQFLSRSAKSTPRQRRMPQSTGNLVIYLSL